MEFKVQDVIKNVIPGIVLIVSIIWIRIILPGYLDYYLKEYDLEKLENISIVIFLSVTFIAGYIIDAIASKTEFFLYENILSRPSHKLLLDTCSKKYKLRDRSDIISAIIIKHNQDLSTINNKPYNKEDTYKIFRCASKDLKRDEPMIAEYYSSYIFARNLSISIIISFLFCVLTILIKYESCDLYFAIGLFFVALITISRWREKSYYYSRQIFYMSR